MPIPVQAWKIADQLSRTHTAALGTRPLEIIQVATALSLKAERFLTLDASQRALAEAAGLAAPDLMAG